MSARNLHPGLNLGRTDADTHRAAEEILFGFWIFLMSDLVLFAILFATYASMSVHGVAGGPGPRDVAALGPAFAETLLLLASTVAVGFASLAMKHRERRGPVLAWLAVTAACGLGFLALEGRDFVRMATELGAAPQVSGFLSAHWLLTGTHFVHVAAGLIWMAVLAVQVATRGVVAPVKLRLMRLALFWHMLDVVWVGIFTFVFLVGAAA
ncbi:cytochrome c oxidase subunit 3 [Albimonas sp. CAU 1670]|uniref:cytochrome c oxidase subunit 3 n=1 Tax=Albimonas sp. CAU 1670 TaxID=3032599 RepID=UPI0023DB358C|nr:cytochrome c oxidase subunit 3 [Albimonas sp. CAU 1670]MDF2235317.1 cytochrome c oxidase subunit 3 [Albimonas sp. CAU 1670]